MVVPSPRFHVTEVGDAIAVTDSPGTAAVAVIECQPPSESHSQVGRSTSWSASVDGEALMVKLGIESCLTACSASIAGVGRTGDVPAAPLGTHTIPPPVSEFCGAQVTM